ncbi:MAG: NAD(P)/FAD-dependent oxidoreductase [Gemmatimonadota bacterium]|nr:NAD(P)/FAD-dependent oxidoreductase [Gemmatimonadota bacterium]
MSYDLVIAGAGPIGLAVAIHARLRGLAPLVLERAPGPVDKACGEGIMPAGVAALEAMGVTPANDRSHPFRGIRYIEDDLVAEGRFAGPPGLGVRRTELTRVLLERATELGAPVRFGAAVDDWEVDRAGIEVRVRGCERTEHARLLVGADGLHSDVRRRAGLDRPEAADGRGTRETRFGLRRHFRLRPWTDLVEVHLADRAEAYVTPVGPELVGVAFLFSPRSPGSTEPTGSPESPAVWDSLLARFPRLTDKLAGADPTDRPRGAGPLRQPVLGRVAPGVALVGDAAGYLDALTGQGIELGLACAEALVETLVSGSPLERYETAYRRLTKRYYTGTRLLLAATRRGPTRRGLVRALGSVPGLFDRAVGAL